MSQSGKLDVTLPGSWRGYGRRLVSERELRPGLGPAIGGGETDDRDRSGRVLEVSRRQAHRLL